jgi:hemerythrin
MGTPLWWPVLATGIREVDLRHEELLASVSALREAARTGDLGLVEGVLGCRERCAAEHFATEERVMWGTGYPALDAHGSLHLSFATELARRKAGALASRSMAFLLVGPMAAPARRRGGP